MALHNLEELTGRARKVEILSRILTNILFVLADCTERCMVECEEVNKEAGYALRQDCKRYFKAAMFNIKMFRGATREIGEDEQYRIGEDADLMYDFIFAAVSRTGKDNWNLLKFFQYIMSYPDLIGVDEVRKGGESFKAVREQLERLKRFGPEIANNHEL